MQNIKYIIAGIMLGGALGAKTGEYLSTVMNLQNIFQWIESGLIFGSLSGLVITLVVLAAVAASSSRKEYEYYSSQENTPVSSI